MDSGHSGGFQCYSDGITRFQTESVGHCKVLVCVGRFMGSVGVSDPESGSLLARTGGVSDHKERLEVFGGTVDF